METGTHGGSPYQRTTEDSTRQVKEKATELTRSARERAMSTVDQQKGQVCDTLDRMARSLEDDRLGGYVAGYARRGADYLRHHSADELLASAQAGLRSRPGLMLSACFVAGLAIARVMRSGAGEGRHDGWRGRDFGSDLRDRESIHPDDREFWRETPGWGQGTREPGQP
jgi:hypothetical protein